MYVFIYKLNVYIKFLKTGEFAIDYDVYLASFWFVPKKGSNDRFRDQELITFIGLKVRELRLAKHLTQEELANECGVPSSQINRIETGKINFTVSYLTKLSQALEVSRKEFIPD